MEYSVRIRSGDDSLEGNLNVPGDVTGVVLIAHVCAGSRTNPRTRVLMQTLQENSLGTLQLSLLSHEEETEDTRSRRYRFNIDMLTERVLVAMRWLQQHSATRDLPIGYFSTSTGAAAVLMAAAERPEAVSAVVTQGGRPDLAGGALSYVFAPVLLIVGGQSDVVIDLNRAARDELIRARTARLAVVPRASHLFEESGSLEQVAQLAQHWFADQMAGVPSEAGMCSQERAYEAEIDRRLAAKSV